MVQFHGCHWNYSSFIHVLYCTTARTNLGVHDGNHGHDKCTTHDDNIEYRGVQVDSGTEERSYQVNATPSHRTEKKKKSLG